MEPSIKGENDISGDRKKRSPDPEKKRRDLQRWQRRKETIGKYMQEKFGLPATVRGMELDVHKPKR
jgi:hypothetical protein